MNENQANTEAKEQSLQREFNFERFQDIQWLVQFDYQNPYANFNRSNVHGRFSTLFRVKELEKYSLALNMAAGLRLSNVVVDNKNVAKDFFSSGSLRQRVTFMPLNQISYKRLERAKINHIMQVTSNKARLALDLIEYDPRVEAAMQ